MDKLIEEVPPDKPSHFWKPMSPDSRHPMILKGTYKGVKQVKANFNETGKQDIFILQDIGGFSWYLTPWSGLKTTFAPMMPDTLVSVEYMGKEQGKFGGHIFKVNVL